MRPAGGLRLDRQNENRSTGRHGSPEMSPYALTGQEAAFFRPIVRRRSLRLHVELASLMVSGTFWDVAGRFEKAGGISADHVRRDLVLQAIWDRDDVSVQALSSPRADSRFGASKGINRDDNSAGIRRVPASLYLSLLSIRSPRRCRRHGLAARNLAKIRRRFQPAKRVIARFERTSLGGAGERAGTPNGGVM